MKHFGINKSARLPEAIEESIERIIEEIQLEGLPFWTLAEQFTCLIYIRHKKGDMDISDARLPLFWNQNRKRIEAALEQCKRAETEWTFIKNIQLIQSEILLSEIWAVASLVFEHFPEAKKKGNLELGAVFEAILNKTYSASKEPLYTPGGIVKMLVEMADLRGGEALGDPACGTGGFLVQGYLSAMEQGNRSPGYVAGWEANTQMLKAAEMNVYLHGIPFGNIMLREEIALGQQLEEFDVILSNPPVSAASRQGNGERGFLIPTRKLHLQFLQLIMQQLAYGGFAAVLVNENVLFSESKAETAIKEALVKEYGLEAVISLPPGAFLPATGAKASILCFGRKLSPDTPVLFYELEKLGYTLNKRRKEIGENDIPGLLDLWAHREEVYGEWKKNIEEGQEINSYGIPVPINWRYKKCWFANRETIMANACELSGKKYKPGDQEEKNAAEPPLQILKRLMASEEETQRQLKELVEIMKKYE